MQIENEKIQLMAYDLIQRAAKRRDNIMTPEALGMYVCGVVDLQAELYSEEVGRVRGVTNADSD